MTRGFQRYTTLVLNRRRKIRTSKHISMVRYTKACKPLGIILKPDGSFKDCVHTCVWMNHMLIHNDMQDKNGVDQFETSIDRTTLITIEQVHAARKICQNANDAHTKCWTLKSCTSAYIYCHKIRRHPQRWNHALESADGCTN